MKKVLEFNAGDRIDRYLAGRLSPEEEARFEEAMLADPELQRELESAMRLRDSLRRLAADGRLSYRAGGPARWFARAAILAAVLVVPATVLWMSMGHTPDAEVQPAAPLVERQVSIIDLYPERSATPEGGLREIAHSGWLVLSVTVADISFERYAVRIEDAAGSEVWGDDHLNTDAMDAIVVGLAGDRLPAGEYTLRVSGVSEAGSRHPAGFYRFRYGGEPARQPAP